LSGTQASITYACHGVFNVARVSHLWLLLLNSAAEVNKEESFDVSKGNGGNKLTRIEPEKRKKTRHARPAKPRVGTASNVVSQESYESGGKDLAWARLRFLSVRSPMTMSGRSLSWSHDGCACTCVEYIHSLIRTSFNYQGDVNTTPWIRCFLLHVDPTPPLTRRHDLTSSDPQHS
jgi:hypothetical protein